MPGPPPKRSSQRRRVNKPEVPITKGVGAAEVPVPEPGGDWPTSVVAWYESLARSGQSTYYEPSDWGLAWLIAENMSRDYAPKLVINEKTGAEHWVTVSINGAKMGNYLKAMSSLLVTEGDRRRARLELERPKPTNANGPEDGGRVAWIDEARRRRSG